MQLNEWQKQTLSILAPHSKASVNKQPVKFILWLLNKILPNKFPHLETYNYYFDKMIAKEISEVSARFPLLAVDLTLSSFVNTAKITENTGMTNGIINNGDLELMQEFQAKVDKALADLKQFS